MTRPFWFDLGDVAVVPLVETPRLLIDPEEFFPGHSGDRAWCFREPWFDGAAGRLVFTIQSFLVVTPERVVLVDACVGDGKRRHRPEFDLQSTGWASRFLATGLAESDVSTVIFTHLHVDHVGWAARWDGAAWVPMFPNARHCVTEPELRYWTGPGGAAAMARTGEYLADTVRPLEAHGLLDLVDPGAAFGPHVRLVPAPGHTPGNSVVRVTGSGGELLILGDTVHHPVQLARPSLNTRYCVHPEQAARTRGRLLRQAAADGTPVLPAHFPYPSAGRTVPDGAGYSLVPATDLLRDGRWTCSMDG